MDTEYMGSERDVRDMAEKLEDVLQVDVDAVEAYNEAIEKVESQEIRTRLSAFRDDHQRHISELSEAIRSMGMERPEREKGVKGTLLEGMTALRSAMGDEQALKAMRQNEVITNRAYERALEDVWTGDARAILERGYADERTHLQWIENQLSVGVGTRDTSSGTYTL